MQPIFNFTSLVSIRTVRQQPLLLNFEAEKKNEMEMDPKNSHFGVKSITLEWNVLDVVVIVVFFVVFAQVKTYINCEAVTRLKTRKGKNTTKS